MSITGWKKLAAIDSGQTGSDNGGVVQYGHQVKIISSIRALMNKDIQTFLTAHLAADNFDLLPIEKGGSDRKFFRICLPDHASFILMHYGTDIAENSYWADINRFLTNLNVAVPRVIAQDARLHFILLEDLGDIDLWSQRGLPWRERRGYYYQVLGEIRKLHAFDISRLPSWLQLAEAYSEKLYRWEHQYFQENFIRAVCHLDLAPAWQKSWDLELDGLIDRLQKIKPSLIHRDFQSQNILLKKNRPTLIDFQGLRQGCLFYDLASLICDPYVTFAGSEQDELLAFYYGLLKPDYSLEVFTNNFYDASAQRLMQALGAYGFLGLKKNKPDFLKHIDNGIRNLLTAATAAATLPVLRELAGECIRRRAGD